MLYLVRSELIGEYPLPPEQWLGLVVKTMEDITKHKQQGKLLVHGALVGQQAGYMIWDVDTHKELQGLLCQLPVWPFLEWEVIPLISTEDVLDSVRQALAGARASA